jgi:hypothetical protein
MPAVLTRTRDNQFSLWGSSSSSGWHHFATGSNAQALEVQAQGLRTLFRDRQFVVVAGTTPPH